MCGYLLMNVLLYSFNSVLDQIKKQLQNNNRKRFRNNTRNRDKFGYKEYKRSVDLPYGLSLNH